MFSPSCLNHSFLFELQAQQSILKPSSTSQNGSLHVTNICPQLNLRIATDPPIQQPSHLTSSPSHPFHQLYAPLSAKTPLGWRRPHNSTMRNMSRPAYVRSSAEPTSCNKSCLYNPAVSTQPTDYAASKPSSTEASTTPPNRLFQVLPHQ
jgi:hypothetical protein